MPVWFYAGGPGGGKRQLCEELYERWRAEHAVNVTPQKGRSKMEPEYEILRAILEDRHEDATALALALSDERIAALRSGALGLVVLCDLARNSHEREARRHMTREQRIDRLLGGR